MLPPLSLEPALIRVLRCRKTASQAAAELKQNAMLAKVARGSHGSSPSHLESHHTDGVSQMSATLTYDEPGFSIPLSYSILSKDIREATVT